VSEFDAVVVGSGPNGLAAAITLLQSGKSVLLLEKASVPGGGARSAEITLPGFLHDTCSAVHPLAVCSPFFKSLPLEKYGLKWIHAPLALAHPFDDGSSAILAHSVKETAQSLGDDAKAYEKFMGFWQENWSPLFDEILQTPLHFPKHPLLLMRFGLSAILSVEAFAKKHFRQEKARGLLAGLGGHSFLPLEKAPSAAIALVLAIAAHGEGWPFPQGGSQSLSNALVAHFKSLGGVLRTETFVQSLSDIPKAKYIFFDLMPKQILKICGDELPSGYSKTLENFRLGPGVFKIDYALSAPIPWKSADCKRAGTIHLGQSLEEIADSERAPWNGNVCERPFILLTQPSLFDFTRAPAGKHTAWAYCHVPRGSTVDMRDKINSQIERFAPGFKDIILQEKISTPLDIEKNNPNYFGGDISGGIADFGQLFVRPRLGNNAYKIPQTNYFICSAATPPGAGVHGLCGYHASRSI
jgi:phytoene dehydrogenase-like protein